MLLARELEIPVMIAMAWHEYGRIALSQNQPELAEQTFREMLACIPSDDQELHARAYYGLAKAAALRKDMKEARLLGEQSATLLETIRHHKARTIRAWLSSLAAQEELE